MFSASKMKKLFDILAEKGQAKYDSQIPTCQYFKSIKIRQTNAVIDCSQDCLYEMRRISMRANVMEG